MRSAIGRSDRVIVGAVDTHGIWSADGAGVVGREWHCGTRQHLHTVVADIACTAIDHQPVNLTHHEVVGGEQERVFRTGALQIHDLVDAAAVNAALQAHVVALVAVGWRNLDGDGGGAGKKGKPLVVVEHVVRTAGKWLHHIVVVDGGTVAVDVVAEHRGIGTGVAGLRKTRRRALGMDFCQSCHEGKSKDENLQGSCFHCTRVFIQTTSLPAG